MSKSLLGYLKVAKSAKVLCNGTHTYGAFLHSLIFSTVRCHRGSLLLLVAVSFQLSSDSHLSQLPVFILSILRSQINAM
jgi:hypothetical protein